MKFRCMAQHNYSCVVSKPHALGWLCIKRQLGSESCHSHQIDLFTILLNVFIFPGYTQN